MNPLTRPMFRLGGKPSADGVGITSGFRTGYQDPEPMPVGTQDRMKRLETEMMEKPQYGWNELIADAYRTSKGATDWRDWVNQGADRALEIQEERKNLPKEQMEMLLKTDKAQTDRLRATTDPTIAGRQQILTEVMTQISDWQNKNPGKGVEDFLQSGNIIEIDAKMRTANPAWPGITEIKLQIEDQLLQQFPGLTTPEFGDDPLPSEVEAARKQLLQSWIGSYLGFKGNAMGGKPIRRGYNLGSGPVMQDQLQIKDQMTEQVDTPQGDVAMTEDVSMTEQVPGPANSDPYVLLRARLPQEVPDDVVRLIAYNPDAFADFASIESQEDVIAFNQKYGVELVINTDQL